MAFELIVKPIVFAALALVLWAIWRAADSFEPAAAGRHRRAVALGAVAIALLLLGPPAWALLVARPGAVLGWSGGLALTGGLLWAYARLIGAARRRAARRHGES